MSKLDIEKLNRSFSGSVSTTFVHDCRRSSGHVLSKTMSVTHHFFYISDITNSSSFNGIIFRQKSMLENFRATVLKLFFVFHSR